MQVHLEGMRVKFIYEGHRLKVEVTECYYISSVYSGGLSRQGPRVTDQSGRPWRGLWVTDTTADLEW